MHKGEQMNISIHKDNEKENFYFSQNIGTPEEGSDITDKQWRGWENIDEAYYNMQKELKKLYEEQTDD